MYRMGFFTALFWVFCFLHYIHHRLVPALKIVNITYADDTQLYYEFTYKNLRRAQQYYQLGSCLDICILCTQWHLA